MYMSRAYQEYGWINVKGDSIARKRGICFTLEYITIYLIDLHTKLTRYIHNLTFIISNLPTRGNRRDGGIKILFPSILLNVLMLVFIFCLGCNMLSRNLYYGLLIWCVRASC